MKAVKKVLFLLVLFCGLGFLMGGWNVNVYAKDNQALQIYPKNLNKNNKKKVGKYYFWGDTKNNLYFSKDKAGKKKTKIAGKVNTAVTDGKKVLYCANEAKGKIKLYQLNNKKKKTFNVKAAKNLHNVKFLNIYGNNLYFNGEQWEGDGLFYVYYKFNIKTKKLKKLKGINENADSCSMGATNGRYFIFRTYEDDFTVEGPLESYTQSHLYDCKTGKIIQCKARGDGFFYNGKLYLLTVGLNKTDISTYKLPSQKKTKVKEIKAMISYMSPVYNGCLYYSANDKYYKFNLKTKSIGTITEKTMNKAW